MTRDSNDEYIPIIRLNLNNYKIKKQRRLLNVHIYIAQFTVHRPTKQGDYDSSLFHGTIFYRID